MMAYSMAYDVFTYSLHTYSFTYTTLSQSKFAFSKCYFINRAASGGTEGCFPVLRFFFTYVVVRTRKLVH